MPFSFVGLFGSYDFLGKSIPGTILFAGIVSVLPRTIGLQSGQNGVNGAGQGVGLNPASVVSLILILLIVGVIIGQGVHTLAIVFERNIAWAGDRLSGTANVFYDLFGSVAPQFGDIGVIEEPEPTEPFEADGWLTPKVVNFLREVWRLFRMILYNWWTGTGDWIYRRYWGTNDAFKRHRLIFEEEVLWYLHPYVNRRRADDVHITKQRFVDAAKHHFDLSNLDFRRGDQVYTLVMAELSSSEKNRAAQMHAMYAFCRSMWVVVFIVTSVYLILLAGYIQAFKEYGFVIPPYESLFDSTPLILAYFPWTSKANALSALVILGSMIVLIFIAGTSIYKKHFVEYIFAEFYTLVEEKESVSETNQENPQ